MGTFNDGDSGSSIRTKINTAIQKTAQAQSAQLMLMVVLLMALRLEQTAR
jgi:hypothetical protein